MAGDSKEPRSLSSSVDYDYALLWLMGELEQGRSQDVIRDFERRFGGLIPDEHRERLESGPLRWDKIVRWSRQNLLLAGLMGSAGRGLWTITDAGRAWLKGHPGGDAKILKAYTTQRRRANEESATEAVKIRGQTIRLAGQTLSLSRSEVLSKIRDAIARGLPPEARRFHRWCLMVDGQRLSIKWAASLVTGLSPSAFNTYQARDMLRKLGLDAQAAAGSSAVSGKADAEQVEADLLTREEFFGAVMANLEGRLPIEVYGRGVNPRTNYLQLTCPAPSCHYELRLLSTYTEVAIHFEGRGDRSLALLEQMRPHLGAWQAQMKVPIHAEPWGTNWARLYIRRPPAKLDVQTANALADDWQNLIEATLPVVKEAVGDLGLRTRQGRRPSKPKVGDLGRAEALLAQEVASVRAYLNGNRNVAPSDERLCDWIQFCYTFEFFAEAAALFNLVRPDAVNPWLYERARKLARACALRQR